MNKIEIHKEICDNLNKTYIAKNADYGDSFARVRREEGEAVILVRLKDKLYRLETLLHGEKAKVTDESIDDTLLDLANYCIMELVERKAENTNTLDKLRDEIRKSMKNEAAAESDIKHQAEHYFEKE